MSGSIVVEQISARSWRAKRRGHPWHKARNKTAAVRAARHDAARRRRNPMGKIKWAWLLGGAALGAAGTTVYSLTQNTAPIVTASNAGVGAGAGLLLGGIAGGLMKKSGATALTGAVGGLGILGALYLAAAQSQPGA